MLIVDSQASLIDMIRGALRLLGVPENNLHSFKEGGAALNLFKQTKPDLLIVDWEMFDMSGLDFVRAVRSSPVNPYVPVIFMTALTTEKRVNEARDCGITEFLAKPFTARTLCEHIEAIVERPRGFVESDNYRGPDRRRKHDAPYTGVERRADKKAQKKTASGKGAVQPQKKLRTATLTTPPNILKQKMGSGGVDTTALAMAQNFLENNKVDFKAIGFSLVYALDEGLKNSKKSGVKSETGIELMLYPAAQLKAQGAMFHYPFVTNIADILVNFLETVDAANDDVLKIVEAHKAGFLYILNNNVTGQGGEYGKKLQAELTDACGRYLKAKKG